MKCANYWGEERAVRVQEEEPVIRFWEKEQQERRPGSLKVIPPIPIPSTNIWCGGFSPFANFPN